MWDKRVSMNSDKSANKKTDGCWKLRATPTAAGAGSYLVRAVSSVLLLASFTAFATNEETLGVLQVGDVELDRGTRSVTRGKRTLELTSLEYDILRHLLENAGRVVSRDQLAEAVMGKQLAPFDRSIDMHISKIRRKLGERPGRHLIKTIRNAGYLFVLASVRG